MARSSDSWAKENLTSQKCICNQVLSYIEESTIIEITYLNMCILIGVIEDYYSRIKLEIISTL